MIWGILLFLVGLIGTLVSENNDDGKWLAGYGICMLSGFLLLAITANMDV